jgi:aminoglycoside phosphotransferase (APT) family kinase protein
MTVSQSRRRLDDLHAGLVDWFHYRHPDSRELTVAPLHRGTSGFSSESIFVEVSWRAGTHTESASYVARLPPAGGGIFPSYDLTRQYQIQAALAEAGLPVPRPIALELNDRWIGSPFLLMERAIGFSLPDTPSYVAAGRLVDAPTDTQRRVQHDFLSHLAQLHTLPWEAMGLGSITPENRRCLASEVHRAQEYLDWAAMGDVPAVLADSIAWCTEHIPAVEPPPSLLWGDPRLGNVIFDADFKFVALLDWEMASIGAAELDFSWFVALHEGAERAHATRLPGFSDRSEAIDLYERSLGRPIRDYIWFEALSLVRADSIHLRIRRMLHTAGATGASLDAPTPSQIRLRELLETF